MKFFKNVVIILIGLLTMSVGSSILRTAKLGVDPFTAMNIGLSSHVGLSLSVFQIIVNCLILVYVYLYNKKAIGLGTILNMFLVGAFIDMFSAMFKPLTHSMTHSLIAQTLCLIIGIALFTLGSAIYMATNQGDSPYDAIAPTICKQTGKSYTPVRTTQDIIVVIIGFLAGGPIGVGTIICAFGCGPLISFWTSIVKPIIKKL
ncbi:hypothetical protein BG262_07835 [Floricoccus penangensis]|uniref:Membrane protein YczE n=1 Tax=Floricoccus penangensis TaxID=1859475 RepID=A0A9Q5P0L2_9LACT|nr:YitT family protein [Floricoccus penangensis]OFI47893.1 hypothetical protein BG262_07835 [Floricoccus penangensis]